MSAENGDTGPKVVWTFPLIRMFTSRNRLLSRQEGNVKIGKNIQNARGKVKERIEKRKESITKGSSDDAEPDELDDIASSIDEINNNRSFSFGQESDEEADSTVDIEEGVFVPVRTNIEPGDTVVWRNNDTQVHRVLSISGLDFGSGRLEPGESYSHTFNDEETVIYIDPIVGRSEMCGAVIVGDSEEDIALPCEQDVDAQLFKDESEFSERGRSMSDAVKDKEDMNIGY